LLAFGAYWFVQQLVKKPDNIIAQVLGKDIAGWAPVAVAIGAFMIASTLAKNAAAKATAALVGQKAPDFEITFKAGDKEEKKSLSQVMKESSLPTVVDFYQNF